MAKTNILELLIDSNTYKNVVRRLDSIHIRKRDVSIYRILKNLVVNINNDDILHKASSVAFSFTLAVFPAIIFLFSLIPYIPIPNIRGNMIALIDDVVMLEQISHTIHDVVANPRGDLLSFGVLFSIILSTNGMMELAQTFNKIYKTIDSRGYWTTRLIATFLTIILAVVLFISILLLTVGNFALEFMVDNGLMAQNFLFYSILVLKFIVLFILFLITISAIYYFAPALHNRWKFISIGSIAATLMSIFVSYLFSFYITNFGTYNKLYGSIGAMIAMMVWIYMISIIMLVGYEVNSSIDQAAQQREDYKKNASK